MHNDPPGSRLRVVAAQRWSVLLFLVVALFACRKDPPGPTPPVGPGPEEPQPTSPVVFDPGAVPYQRLSAYAFFTGDMREQNPACGVLPFDVITPLFSDYAKKARFVWMAEGAAAEYAGDHQPLRFDDNTVLIKTFYYDGVQPANDRRLIETRLMIKVAGAWMFANYVWNAEQTDAVLDLRGSFTPVTYSDANGSHTVDYRIPSEAECLTCHKENGEPTPIGPKPQNMDRELVYAGGTAHQFTKWEQQGYLRAGMPQNVNKVVRWDDPAADLNDRVRAYLDMNCAHCHADQRHCDYRPVRFGADLTQLEANMGVCVPPHEPIPGTRSIVERGAPERSTLWFRLNTNDEVLRMPLMGRSVIHQEAVDLVAEWILALEGDCP